MDKRTAKELLSAYRPEGSDALDENLKDALELAERDPEMKQWFESQIVFDRTVSSSLKLLSAPETGKSAILATALLDSESEQENGPKRIVSTNWWQYTAAAAMIAFAALFTFQYINSQDPDLRESVSSTWLDSVKLLADSALPLDKRGSEIASLDNWLTQNDAPASNSIPAVLTEETDLAGCRIFDLPNGKKASLLCFTKGSQFVHVFVVRKSDLDNQPVTEQTWERKGDWNLFAWTEGDVIVTVASKLPADTITPWISRA